MMLVPSESHILIFAYLALLTDFSNSFYLESKLPALSSTLCQTLRVLNRGIICERTRKHSLKIGFSKIFERLKWIAL